MYEVTYLPHNSGLNNANKSKISILPNIIAHIIMYFEKIVNSK